MIGSSSPPHLAESHLTCKQGSLSPSRGANVHAGLGCFIGSSGRPASGEGWLLGWLLCIDASHTCLPCEFSRANRMVLPGSSGPEGSQRPPQTARKPPKPKMNTTSETCAAPQTAPTRSLASDAEAQQRCQMASLHLTCRNQRGHIK